MSNIVKLHTFKGVASYTIISTLLLLTYLGILINIDSNTLIMQLLGAFLISLVSMFLIVRSLMHKPDDPYSIGSAIKMGLIGGVASAAVLLAIETLLFALGDIKLAPDVMANSGLPYFGLQAMLVFEMVAFSLISSLACFQYLKKPLEGFKYRQPKGVQTSIEHS